MSTFPTSLNILKERTRRDTLRSRKMRQSRKGTSTRARRLVFPRESLLHLSVNHLRGGSRVSSDQSRKGNCFVLESHRIQTDVRKRKHFRVVNQSRLHPFHRGVILWQRPLLSEHLLRLLLHDRPPRVSQRNLCTESCTTLPQSKRESCQFRKVTLLK